VIGASPAAASVVVGQVGTSGGTCGGPLDLIQTGVAAGSSYTFSETGTVTSWSHNAFVAPSQMMAMKIFRKVSDPDIYQVVAHDGPHPISSGLFNTFPANVHVEAGDLLGLNANPAGCVFPGTTPDTFQARSASDLANGQAAQFNPGTGSRLDISAVLEPSNAITVGATTPNKKKGTATLDLTLPNPGDLTASGSGVQASSAGGAHASRAVTTGPAQLLISATGKKRKKLNQKGKVTLSVAITYTPENGAPGTQSVQVQLKKKVRKKK
jgi:hypothetical protein